MKVFNRIFWAALFGGGIAGLFLACIQHFTVVPMILEAETYEFASVDTHHDHHADIEHGHHHGEDAWAPADGPERTFYTAMNSIIVGIGFGLLLTACYALRQTISLRNGMIWGLAGFAVFSLAPALGLPPELPGDATAGLEARQMWWLLTVCVTAAGLWIIAFLPPRYLKLLGVVLIALPHVFGAPQPDTHGGLAPEELRNTFIYTSLITNALFWIVLGVLSAYFFNRGGDKVNGNRARLAAEGENDYS